MRSTAITAASILFYLGLVYLVADLYVALFIARNRELPVLFGIRAGGDSFIETLGLDAMILSFLLWAAVNGLEVLAGY